ncbi:hypothetical protein D4764_14G0005380 [Takifugu flavidus]|uniref:Uncharacterized protein n=1 Tax=Takifugu flavidus TaxID=433684 RepID=A0A5C6P596_9TELE|nr:hypothetical protein D4764_14G0005380 [Takifugu flavidus]
MIPSSCIVRAFTKAGINAEAEPVVTPWEGGPMLPLRAVPGRTPWAEVRALANVPHPQAWLHEGVPVTRIRARGT